MNVLVLNSGSSTLKFQVIATDLERIGQYNDDRICRGQVEGIGERQSFMSSTTTSQGTPLHNRCEMWPLHSNT